MNTNWKKRRKGNSAHLREENVKDQKGLACIVYIAQLPISTQNKIDRTYQSLSMVFKLIMK